MRFAQIREMDISNGEGIGVSLFTQGCPLHCEGCFQPETWDMCGGQEWTSKQEKLIFQLLQPEHITRLSILGGEPFIEQNMLDLHILCSFIKGTFPGKKIWAWSGYTWEELQEKYKGTPYWDLFNYIDILVVGRFRQEEKDLTLMWRGSRNQEVLDLTQTLVKGEKIYYEG